MARAIDLKNAMDISTLYDWYITSVSQDDEPVWTEKHIDELSKDFYVIPKETPVIEVEPVKHGKWGETYYHYGEGDFVRDCSECGEPYSPPTRYCPNCGARMDGE